MKTQTKEKKAKEKNPLPEELKGAPGSLIIIAVYLGATLPLCFFVTAFTWYWFVFGLIAVVVPVGLLSYKILMEARGNYTREQKNNASLYIGKSILLYWLFDLTYMAIFNHWLIWIYIFGVLSVIIVLLNVARSFLSDIKLPPFFLVFDFLLAIALSVYLIYLIPDADVKEVLIPVIAAVYGGLITLVGVLLTIKENEKRHKRENNKIEIFKYMLSETIKKCTVEEFYFQRYIFEKYVLPKIDVNRPPKEDKATEIIINQPFVFDKEIIELSLSGSIDDKSFIVYADLKSSYRHYIETKITFYGEHDVYKTAEENYRRCFDRAKKLIEQTNK